MAPLNFTFVARRWPNRNQPPWTWQPLYDMLGRYARENQYADLLESILKDEKIFYEREKNISKTTIDKNRSDFIIDKTIVVEMKVKTFTNQDDYYLVKRYLEILNLKLGILVNFRSKYLNPKRVLNSKIP